MTVFLYNDALFGSVAPVAALKIHVKVDWSLLHFSQKFNLWSKHRFSYVNVRKVPREMDMFKTLDDRSGGYRGTLDQLSVHG